MFERNIKKSLFGYSKKSVVRVIEALKEDNRQAINQSKQLFETRISEYKKELDKLETELESEQRKLDPLLKENSDLKYKNDVLQMQLDETASQLDALKSALSEKDEALAIAHTNKNKMDGDYTNILNNYNKLRMEIAAYRETIDRKNYEIDALKSKLSKSDLRYNTFIDTSKVLSSDIVSSGNLFDEKLSHLREYANQITQLCSDTENIFNKIIIEMANFIMASSSNLDEKGNKHDSQNQKVS